MHVGAADNFYGTTPLKVVGASGFEPATFRSPSRRELVATVGRPLGAYPPFPASCPCSGDHSWPAQLLRIARGDNDYESDRLSSDSETIRDHQHAFSMPFFCARVNARLTRRTQ